MFDEIFNVVPQPMQDTCGASVRIILGLDSTCKAATGEGDVCVVLYWSSFYVIPFIRIQNNLICSLKSEEMI